MNIKPGQLLITKSSFEASQFPLDYSSQLKLSIDKRKTIKTLKIDRGKTLLVVEVPKDTTHFFPGWQSTITAKRIIFLYGDKLCLLTSINNWNDYFDICFPEQSELDRD